MSHLKNDVSKYNFQLMKLNINHPFLYKDRNLNVFSCFCMFYALYNGSSYTLKRTAINYHQSSTQSVYFVRELILIVTWGPYKPLQTLEKLTVLTSHPYQMTVDVDVT